MQVKKNKTKHFHSLSICLFSYRLLIENNPYWEITSVNLIFIKHHFVQGLELHAMEDIKMTST